MSEEELQEVSAEKLQLMNMIDDFKTLLTQTDYIAIKYAEGILSAEEYSSIKKQRQEWRYEIGRLEEEIKSM